MQSVGLLLAIVIVGYWQVRQLRNAGSTKEAWAAGFLWVLALAIAIGLATPLPAPSPLGLIFRLFRGLSIWLKTF